MMSTEKKAVGSDDKLKSSNGVGKGCSEVLSRSEGAGGRSVVLASIRLAVSGGF